MIELPEAATIARQLTEELAGKQIESAVRGNSPHKFAFYTRSPEEYATISRGKVVGTPVPHGSEILVPLEPDFVLMLGGGGERILFHLSAATLPKKHHLLLHFTDDTYLTVTVMGWGSVKLLRHAEVGEPKVSPLSDAFTPAYLQRCFDALAGTDARSIKFFVISQPGIWGVGNGYLQDILFRAGIHPRRRAVETTAAERDALYRAIRDTLREAVAQGGRDTEKDLYGDPGGYRAVLDRRAKGMPCPRCATPIQAISFLGGTSYFCPRCQT